MSGKLMGILSGAVVSLSLLATGCGGGSSNSNAGSGSSSGGGSGGGATANSVALNIGPGPSDMTNPAGGYTNILFTTITLCEPGTSTCQSIDHVLVDTGSFGLRVLASEIPSGLSLATSQIGGKDLYECLPFVDSYAWGTVVTADMKIASEKASSMPVQLIQSTAAPLACANPGNPNAVTVATGSQVQSVNDLGAKGILGVGNFSQDCGTYCATSVQTYDQYFACTSATASTCSQVATPVAQQVVNPVALFATDNNGVVIQLASVADTGAASDTGTMYFGIGTQSNNQPASGVTVLGLDGFGNFSTKFQSTTYGSSFADTGSNAYFFGTYSGGAASTGINACNLGTSANPAYFYCPSSDLSESATVTGNTNSNSKTVKFTVGNANTLNGYALDDLAATNSDGKSFDWGLPLFYGKTVYIGMYPQTSALGSGPYVAF